MNFGIHSAEADLSEDSQNAVFRVLNRECDIAALDALVAAMEPKKHELPVSTAAIAIDTNVFLRIPDHKSSEDIIDYLNSRHNAPIILPGQVIQEFWNNQLVAVNTVAKKLQDNFKVFRRSVQSIKDDFGSVTEDIEKHLDQFETLHGHVYDAENVKKTRRMLEALRTRAMVPFVSRTRFHTLAAHRHRTKTPPGFEDTGDGDFFVWADFLMGLRSAQMEGVNYDHSVFVTHDKKRDWMRNGVAHPVLSAEATAVSGVSFEIWSLDELAESINAVL